MDIFDGILYINLAHRTDRRKHIEYELFESPVSKLLNISRKKVTRIDGVYNPHKGHLGCTESHIKAQQYALDHGWERVLILEDDFEWLGWKYVVNNLKSFRTLITSSTPLKWDVLFFSANILGSKSEPNLPQNFRRIINGQAGAGYAVNGSEYIKKLQNTFRESAEKLRQEKPVPCSAPDILWKKHQRTDYWYAFAPHNIGKQYSSYSDNRRRHMAYKHT